MALIELAEENKKSYINCMLAMLQTRGATPADMEHLATPISHMQLRKGSALHK
jgi:hypothetical protein